MKCDRAKKEMLVVNPCDVSVDVRLYLPYCEKAFRTLSSFERRLIRLRFWEGLSIGKIADLMVMTWSETDELIDQAVEKIRAVIREENNKQPTAKTNGERKL